MSDTILAIDIGTTNIVSIVASNDFNNKINILGIGKVKSQGIKKGNIVDINEAGSCIKESVTTAINSSGTSRPKVVVSVSGANAKTHRSVGSINIPSGQITHNEIKQVLKMALHNAQVIPEYDILHVIPVSFRVDDGSNISNPLNMNGSRLEVSVNVITTKKTFLINIKNTLKLANLEVNKFILSGYANAIATLEEDQKKLGTAVINIGATTSEIVVYKGSTIIYNTFLPIGSENITYDLSVMLHTPYSAANMIKKQYGTLLPISEDETTIKKVKLPTLGNETESKEISLEQIQPILHARVEEIFVLIRDKLYESSVIDSIDGGIILTGGMTQTTGVKELASEVFVNLPVKVANPKNIQNGYIDFQSPMMATIAGMLYYALDDENCFELDSNGNLRAKKQVQISSSTRTTTDGSDNMSQNIEPEPTNESQEISLADLGKLDEEALKPKKFGGFWDKISRWL